MTEAMPFLQKAILLSYDPRPFREGAFVCPVGFYGAGRFCQRRCFLVERLIAKNAGDCKEINGLPQQKPHENTSFFRWFSPFYCITRYSSILQFAVRMNKKTGLRYSDVR